MEELISNKSSYSIDKLKDMRRNINLLTENEHVEILNIIKNDGFKYTENHNGIFVNMRKLRFETLNLLEKFINFCNENIHQLQNDKLIRVTYNNYIENT